MPVFCNDCGAENIEGSTCCEECGTSLSVHNKISNSKNPANNKTIPPISVSNTVSELLNKGKTFAEQRKYKEAIECYDKALEIDRNNVLIWHYKGVSLTNLRREKEAIICYDRALEIDSNNAFAWSKKGDTLYQLSKYEQAITCYNKALALDWNNVSAWYKKGDSLSEIQNYQEAINCYDKVLQIDSNNVLAWHKKGINFYLSGKYEEAINCYDNALKIDPDDVPLWNTKGLIFYQLNKYEEAINCYDKALELDPDDASAWHNKGSSFYELGKYEEAVNYYDKALELDRYDASLWNDRGDVLEKLSRYEEAISCYDKASELDPDDASAWHKKRNILLKNNFHTDSEINLKYTLSCKYIHISSGNKTIYLLVDVFPFAQPLSSYLPINLTCVIDESMYEQEKFEYLKKAIINIIELLRSDDLLRIVFCSENPKVLAFNQKTVNKENFINMLQLIDTIYIPQGRNMYKGIIIACDKVMKNYSPNCKNHIILFTADLISEENKCLMKCVEEAKKGISFSSMGVGNDFNQKLMMDIAEVTGGKSYYIDVLSDIPNSFAQELKGLQSVVVQNPILHLKLSKNVQVKRAYKIKPLISDLGNPQIVNRVYSVKLNDLQKDEPQSILYELILPSIQAGSFRITQTILDYDVIMKGEKGKQITQDIVIDYTSDYSLTGTVDSYVMHLVDLVGVFNH